MADKINKEIVISGTDDFSKNLDSGLAKTQKTAKLLEKTLAKVTEKINEGANSALNIEHNFDKANQVVKTLDENLDKVGHRLNVASAHASSMGSDLSLSSDHVKSIGLFFNDVEEGLEKSVVIANRLAEALGKVKDISSGIAGNISNIGSGGGPNFNPPPSPPSSSSPSNTPPSSSKVDKETPSKTGIDFSNFSARKAEPEQPSSSKITPSKSKPKSKKYKGKIPTARELQLKAEAEKLEIEIQLGKEAREAEELSRQATEIQADLAKPQSDKIEAEERNRAELEFQEEENQRRIAEREAKQSKNTPFVSKAYKKPKPGEIDFSTLTSEEKEAELAKQEALEKSKDEGAKQLVKEKIKEAEDKKKERENKKWEDHLKNQEENKKNNQEIEETNELERRAEEEKYLDPEMKEFLAETRAEDAERKAKETKEKAIERNKVNKDNPHKLPESAERDKDGFAVSPPYDKRSQLLYKEDDEITAEQRDARDEMMMEENPIGFDEAGQLPDRVLAEVQETFDELLSASEKSLSFAEQKSYMLAKIKEKYKGASISSELNVVSLEEKGVETGVNTFSDLKEKKTSTLDKKTQSIVKKMLEKKISDLELEVKEWLIEDREGTIEALEQIEEEDLSPEDKFLKRILEKELGRDKDKSKLSTKEKLIGELDNSDEIERKAQERVDEFISGAVDLKPNDSRGQFKEINDQIKLVGTTAQQGLKKRELDLEKNYPELDDQNKESAAIRREKKELSLLLTTMREIVGNIQKEAKEQILNDETGEKQEELKLISELKEEGEKIPQKQDFVATYQMSLGGDDERKNLSVKEREEESIAKQKEIEDKALEKANEFISGAVKLSNTSSEQFSYIDERIRGIEEESKTKFDKRKLAFKNEKEGMNPEDAARELNSITRDREEEIFLAETIKGLIRSIRETAEEEIIKNKDEVLNQIDLMSTADQEGNEIPPEARLKLTSQKDSIKEDRETSSIREREEEAKKRQDEVRQFAQNQAKHLISQAIEVSPNDPKAQEANIKESIALMKIQAETSFKSASEILKSKKSGMNIEDYKTELSAITKNRDSERLEIRLIEEIIANITETAKQNVANDEGGEKQKELGRITKSKEEGEEIDPEEDYISGQEMFYGGDDEDRNLSVKEREGRAKSKYKEIRGRAEEIANEFITEAVESDSSKEQFKTIDEKVKSIEAKSKIDFDEAMYVHNETKGGKSSTKASKDLAEINRERKEDQLLIGLIKEIIETMKAGAREEIARDSEGVKKEIKAIDKLKKKDKEARDPEDKLTTAYKKSLIGKDQKQTAKENERFYHLKKAGSIASNSFNRGAGLASSGGGYAITLGSVAMIPFVGAGAAKIGQRIVDTVSGLELAQKSANAATGGGIGGRSELDIADLTSLGYTKAETYGFAKKLARARQSAAYTKKEQAIYGDEVGKASAKLLATSKAYDIDQGTILNLAANQQFDTNKRGTFGDIQSQMAILKRAGSFGSDGTDMSRLISLLEIQNNLTSNQSKIIEKVNTDTNAKIMATFQNIGGSFADARMGERIGSIDSALKNPQGDFRQAFSYEILSNLFPGKSQWEIEMEQEKGLASYNKETGETYFGASMREMLAGDNPEVSRRQIEGLGRDQGLSKTQSERLFQRFKKDPYLMEKIFAQPGAENLSEDEVLAKIVTGLGEKQTGEIDQLSARKTDITAKAGAPILKKLGEGETAILDIVEKYLLEGAESTDKNTKATLGLTDVMENMAAKQQLYVPSFESFFIVKHSADSVVIKIAK